ncbi:hypothetical protein BH09BAC6_BH09BAC6_20330 [soil metagenome]|jgi:N-acetylmuramoyl-L-alanine amidase
MKNKALRRLICGLSVLLTSLPFFTFALNAFPKKDTITNNGYKIKTIVVDAGHGTRKNGSHSGASGSFSTESNVTLAIALKLRRAIEKEMDDVKVVMTRTTEDDVPLATRSDIANENKGNLFISIHCNSLSDRRRTEIAGYHKGRHGKKTPIYKTVSVPDRSGKGVLLLVYSTKREGPQLEALRENADVDDKEYKDRNGYDPSDPTSAILIAAFKNKYRKQSIHMADLINNEFTQNDHRPSDGVKEQVVLVLDHTAMPSVLVETGFINNPDDERYLNSEDGQNEIVASIVRALKNYKQEVEQVTE